MSAKIAKKTNHKIPAVKMPRVGFNDQKIEAVAKSGSHENAKNLRSVMPGYFLPNLIFAKSKTAASTSNKTNQISGNDNSKFIDSLEPIAMIGKYEKNKTAGKT